MRTTETQWKELAVDLRRGRILQREALWTRWFWRNSAAASGTARPDL